MTDHKYTDELIVELLKSYAKRQCDKCNVKDLGTCCGSCYITAVSQAADLINRQKAQIIKEQNKNSKLRNERNHLKAENERLKKELTSITEKALLLAENAKTEAIKEFAENLKQDIKDHRLEMNMNGLKGTRITDEMTYETIIEYIDNLVKEMTEGANNA